jgi:hypothetical protein
MEAIMNSEARPRRPEAEICDLTDRLTRQYLYGGPPHGPHPLWGWNACEVHRYILQWLDEPPGHDRQALHQILEECSVESPAALRAVLRLIGSYSAMTALLWVLDEPLLDLLGGATPDRDDVLRVARAYLPELKRL